jgi:hypothetical protein
MAETPTQQSLRMQRRAAAERQTGQLLKAKNAAGSDYEKSIYQRSIDGILKAVHPITGKEKKAAKGNGY